MKKDLKDLTAIGWREWVSFPEWKVNFIKVKVDTGARTSSLHVSKTVYFEKDSQKWIRFTVHPWQESSKDSVILEAPLVAYKEVKSSSGYLEERPVVRTRISVAGQTIEADITLTNRSQMGFRMLLGREAIRRKFIVIPGLSYIGGKPDKVIILKNRGKY